MPVYFYPLMLDGMARKDQRHTHTHYSACIATDDGSDYSAQALSSKKKIRIPPNIQPASHSSYEQRSTV
jgi:hypothetical protein